MLSSAKSLQIKRSQMIKKESAVKIEKEDRRIKVSFPYNPKRIAKLKKLAGYKWHPEERYWSFPYSDAVLEKILLIFNGERVDVDPALYLEPLRKELISRKYSRKTVKAYTYYNKDFLKIIQKEPRDVTEKDIRDYLFLSCKG
jgi:hypothetical protein